MSTAVGRRECQEEGAEPRERATERLIDGGGALKIDMKANTPPKATATGENDHEKLSVLAAGGRECRNNRPL